MPSGEERGALFIFFELLRSHLTWESWHLESAVTFFCSSDHSFIYDLLIEDLLCGISSNLRELTPELGKTG